MNILAQYKRDSGLSYAEIGRRCGLSRSIVMRQCKGDSAFGAETAIRYHVKLGIPLQALRPDLYDQGRTVAGNAL